MQIYETRTEKVSREDRGKRGSEIQAQDHAGTAGQDAGFTEEEKEKFFSGVNRNGQMPDQVQPWYLGIGRCWHWPHCHDKDHYGRILLRGKYMKAHRVSWMIHKGAIPEGLCVLHQCDNTSCVNPGHLWLGTNRDNVRDRDRKGRNNAASGDNHGLRLHPEAASRGKDHYLRKHPEKSPRGERHGASKLTDAIVVRIRTIHATGKVTQRQIAKNEGVNFKTVNKIVLRTRWKHLV